MARISPLLAHHAAVGATLLPYGPPESGIQLVESFAPFGLEYAALRTSAAMFDAPSRGLIRVLGADRAAFLQRMVTGDLRGCLPWHTRRAFWLNRKGRIDADLLTIELPSEGTSPLLTGSCTLLELDAHSVKHTVETLNAFVIADDVTLDDLSDSTHQLQLHGPAALSLLAANSAPIAGPALLDLKDGQASMVNIATVSGPVQSLIIRQDLCGDPGMSILCSAASALAVYDTLSELPPSPTIEGGALVPRGGTNPNERRARRIGWHAFNVARIEAGTPLFNLDFGPSSLPHETGHEVLKTRVSFTKGCYLGQEVVARMHALGHPKQRIVALDFNATSNASAAQPVTGSLVFAATDVEQPPVGAVTSSAISPMLGNRAICFAMVRHASSNPGTTLHVQPNPGADLISAKVRETLRFWSRA